MAFDFTTAVAQLRRITQQVFGAEAFYEDPSVPGLAVVNVRWHNRIAITGGSVDDGYSTLIDGVNRVIFNREELVQNGIELARGGKLTFSHPQLVGVVLKLAEREPYVGPIEEIWQVAA